MIESDAALFTTTMDSKDIFDEYYRVLKAQVDTIKAHGGNPSYHWAVYREHYEALTVSKDYERKRIWTWWPSRS